MKTIERLSQMKKTYKRNRFIEIPTLRIQWRLRIQWSMLDFRAWHYVWIDGDPCDWWACEDELDDLKERYEGDIRFEKIPWRKTVLR